MKERREGLNKVLLFIKNALIAYSPGMRVIKTVMGMFFSMLLGYSFGRVNLFTAPISCVICMVADYRTGPDRGIKRVLGTLVAGVYALVFLWIFGPDFLERHGHVLYFFIFSLFTIPLMDILIALNLREALIASVVSYILICMVPSSLDRPEVYAMNRVIDVVLGSSMAVFINWLPALNRLGDWHRRKRMASILYLEKNKRRRS